MKYGKVIEEWDSQNSMWIVTCKRDGYPDVVQTFGYNDAIAAGFISYDPKSNTFGLGRRKSDAWLSNPKRMCQMRARSFALRDAFPDILNGINFEGDGYDEIPNPTAEAVTEVTPDVQQITEQKNDELYFRAENSNFPRKSKSNSSGLGLATFQKRLELMYKDRYTYTTKVEDGVYISELKVKLEG